jgi:hypothetical protein
MKHGNGKSINRIIFPIATFDYHILNQSNSYRSRTTFSVDTRWFSWNQWLLALLGPILSFQHGNQKGLHPTGSKLRPKLGTAVTRGWVVGRWWAIERSFHRFCGPTHDMSLVLVFRWSLKSSHGWPSGSQGPKSHLTLAERWIILVRGYSTEMYSEQSLCQSISREK